MAKVKSFNIKPGERIGNYRVIENIGRGWEGEVYKVAEVPTEAIRALKLFRTDDLGSVRHLIHFAWFYEQVRCTGHFPVYYHYGQWFLDDDNGCWYLVFEFIKGDQIKNIVSGMSEEEKEALCFQLVSAVANVHRQGFAIGDFSTLENVFLSKDQGIIFVDCETGEPDHPNSDFQNDCINELLPAINLFFKNKPDRIVRFVSEINGTKSFTEQTLSELLQNINQAEAPANITGVLPN